MPQPSIGRAVHYVSRGSLDGVFPPACRAATISEVGDQDPAGERRLGIVVTNPTGHFFHPLAMNGGVAWGDETGKTNVHLCDGSDHAPGTWHWPARTSEAGSG